MPARKILILISNLDVGGMEMDLLRNMPRVSRRDFEIVVFPFSSPGALAPEMARRGLRVLGDVLPEPYVGVAGRPDAAGGVFWRQIEQVCTVVRDVLRVARVIRSERIDAVHCFLPKAYFVGIVAAVLAGCSRRVMSRVGLNLYQKMHPHLGWLERNWLHRAVTRVVGNSVSILDELRAEGVPPEKLRLLYNGIDVVPYAVARKNREAIRARLGLPPDRVLITVVGNLHPYKGHLDLLQALLVVRATVAENWEVWIAGRDEAGNLDRYVRWCEENGLSRKVRFLGVRSDIPELLAAADIHVHPSHHEGLPNSVLEAMAAGVAVLASEVGGVPELVEDDVSGRLVPPHAPATLADELLRLLGDTALRERLGRAAAKRAEENFSIEASVRGYEKLYGDLFR